jgi:flagellar biosynthetic protein FliP
MTTDAAAPARRRTARHLVRHYLEMVVAMVVGMVVLGPVWGLVWPGWTTTAFEVHLLVMATDMAIGMAAWMAFRRHSVRAIAEMSAAMYVPFLVLLVPYWLGVLSAGTVMTAGHLLMLPAMAAPMLWRRHEYVH